MIHYAAFDADGRVLGIEDDMDAAVDAALGAHPESRVRVEYIDDLEDNPPNQMARSALKRSGLERIDEGAVMPMPLADAHDILLPYFDGLSIGGRPVRIYDQPHGMVKAWISQNYKTAKRHPGQKSDVQGLSLVPHHLVAEMAKRRRIYGQKFQQRVKRQLPTLPTGFTLCAGSNQLCRESCLVFAGQNAAALYNSYRKAAQTLALLNEPEAFLRVLVAAIDKHRKRAPRENYVPYVRMNVLSDIPWELVCPWIFDMFDDLQFYDYTKLAGRDVPDNYDITFSFSGTNEKLAKREIDENGRRVAVVFLAHRKRKGQWQAWKRAGRGKEIPLPRDFWGLPVVDGDVSDVRPLDPEPSIVGLRWKSPSGERAGVTVDPSDPAFTFVVPVYVVDGTGFTRPNPSRDQWMVAAVTPRYQPIIHDVAQPFSA